MTNVLLEGLFKFLVQTFRFNKFLQRNFIYWFYVPLCLQKSTRACV